MFSLKKALPGFTLIELLIVVAIIAILAAIAVPNFLEAQIRSKVARVHGEFHTCRTAIESYRVDYNMYPNYNGLEKFITPSIPDDWGPHFLPYELTTPIAYLASLFDEIFEGRNTPVNVPRIHPYHYFTRKQSPEFFDYRELAIHRKVTKFEYFIWSNGPDLWCDGGMLLFDPTNGSVSTGDVMIFAP